MSSLKGSARRREIALIALELFTSQGYAGTSMADVARKIGTTKGALYHHFATKEELFVSALAMDTSEPLEAIERLAAQPGDPAERWRAALGHAHDAVFKGAMGHMLPVLAQTGNQIPTVARDYHQQVISRFRAGLRRIYSDAERTPGYRTLNAQDIDQIVFGPLLANALTQSLMANAGELQHANLRHTDRTSFIEMIERLTRSDAM
ncbi:MAG: TetR/AcrR family transcriptional regulator [Pseudomonadota bacterium]